MIYYPPLKILNATAFYSPLDFLAYAAHTYCCPLWAHWKERKPRPLLVKSRRGQSFRRTSCTRTPPLPRTPAGRRSHPAIQDGGGCFACDGRRGGLRGRKNRIRRTGGGHFRRDGDYCIISLPSSS